MKKLLFSIVLIISCLLLASCVIDDGKDDFVTIAFDLSATKGAITMPEFMTNQNNPFLSMYSYEEPDEAETQVMLNMAGVTMQCMPIIPGLQTDYTDVNTFAHSMNGNVGKTYYAYGLPVKVDTFVNNKDGYFVRYYLYPNDDSETPFYQIDYYYSRDKKCFSYRGVMSVAFGTENDSIRYFQMNNVSVKNNSFTANSNNNYRIDVFDFKDNARDVDHYDKCVISTYDLATKFSNDLVANAGLNPKFYSYNKFTYAMNQALKGIYGTSGVVYDVSNSKINKTEVQDVTYGLNPELWNIKTAEKFMKSYYTWNGTDFPFEKESYSSLEEFNNSNLELYVDVDNVPENIGVAVTPREETGIYYPSIYSLTKGEGAVLDPKDYYVVKDTYSTTLNTTYYLKNFDSAFFKKLGYSSTMTYDEFAAVHLKNCGVTE